MVLHVELGCCLSKSFLGGHYAYNQYAVNSKKLVASSEIKLLYCFQKAMLAYNPEIWLITFGAGLPRANIVIKTPEQFDMF